MPGIAAVLCEPQNQNFSFRYFTLHFSDRCVRTTNTCLRFCCSIYCLFCVVLYIDSVYMFIALLLPGAYQNAVNKYIIS